MKEIPISIPYEHCYYEWEEYYCTVVTGAVEYDWAISGTGATISEDGSRYVDVYSADRGYKTLQVRVKNECDQWSDWRNRSIWIGLAEGESGARFCTYNLLISKCL